MNIGILGAGQLGSMLAEEGIDLGHHFFFYSDELSTPAEKYGEVFNKERLDEFKKTIDLATYETENTSLGLISEIEKSAEIFPPKEILSIAQNRGFEKALFNNLNIPCANSVIVRSVEELRFAVDQIGLPSILKTTTDGYDGKGQFFIRNESEIQKAWESLSTSEAILEGFVNFNRELSIIGVRGLSGEQVFYPLVENIHKDGILRITIAPAKKISNETQRLAEDYITKIFDSTNHIGALTVELFETNDGLLVNEIAPRVHNSGHWTINGCTTSQFENHIRAISGMPLGSIKVKSNWCAMINIIGKIGNIQQFAQNQNIHVLLYGKTERKNRKIGHINVVAKSKSQLFNIIQMLSEYYPKDIYKSFK